MAGLFTSALVSLLLVGCSATTDDSTAAVQTRVKHHGEVPEPHDDVPEPTEDEFHAELNKMMMSSARNLRTGEKMNPLIKWLEGHQKFVNIIDVGVGESGFGGGPVGPYDEALLGPNVFAVLVEPNPPRFARLNQTLIHDIDWKTTPRFHMVNAAITGDHPFDFAELEGKANAAEYEIKDKTTFWTVSHDLYTDRAAPAADAAAGAEGALLHPDAPAWLETEVGSLHKDRVLAHHTDVPDMTEEQFEPYVRQINVTNMLPKELFSEVGMGSYQVDILKTSAEGADAEIIEAFFTVGGFHPSMIVWHVGKLGEPGCQSYTDMVRTITSLQLRGYSHHCTKDPQMWHCPEEAMAWRLHKSSGYGPR